MLDLAEDRRDRRQQGARQRPPSPTPASRLAPSPRCGHVHPACDAIVNTNETSRRWRDCRPHDSHPPSRPSRVCFFSDIAAALDRVGLAEIGQTADANTSTTTLRCAVVVSPQRRDGSSRAESASIRRVPHGDESRSMAFRSLCNLLHNLLYHLLRRLFQRSTRNRPQRSERRRRHRLLRAGLFSFDGRPSRVGHRGAGQSDRRRRGVRVRPGRVRSGIRSRGRHLRPRTRSRRFLAARWRPGRGRRGPRRRRSWRRRIRRRF